MRYLLDVNVLLALMDPAHVSHSHAHTWFARTRSAGWASCPLTQNGVVRIASQPTYPNSPGAPGVVGQALSRFVADPNHEFWPDDVSLLDGRLLDISVISRSADVTDTYLLALAVRHRGSLATFDQRLRTTPVPKGDAHLTLIPTK